MSAVRYALTAPARFAQEVRKSSFVAKAAASATPEEALAFIAAAGDAGATHNCWAYRIGQQYRFSDDGEPAGTAGKPILAAIDGQGMDQTAVVVTRWFGGIKLGAGGLVRAYGGCAAECLRMAAKRPLIETVDVEFPLAFASLPILQARLPEIGAHKTGETFDSEGAVIRLRLPTTRLSDLREFVRDLSRGRAQVKVVDAT